MSIKNDAKIAIRVLGAAITLVVVATGVILYKNFKKSHSTATTIAVSSGNSQNFFVQ